MKWWRTNEVQLWTRVLYEKEIPARKEEIPNIRIGDPEVKVTVHTTVIKESFNLIDYVSRFSNWTKAVGVISYLRRPFKKMVKSLGASHYTRPTGPRPLELTKGKRNTSEPKVRRNWLLGNVWVPKFVFELNFM